MKVLVVGCGSIGRRHVNNLLKLDNIENILIYTKHCPENLKTEDRKEKIVIINSLRDAEVDSAIIANETYKHIDTAIFLAEKGINLFIEKPLSHNLKKVDSLRDVVKRKKIKAFIGYNLRFLGAIEYIKDRLSKGILGNLYFAKIEVGQNLLQWRPDRDYRNSYSSSREKGGGVALDLSHEIDYMRYLFGDPCYWKVIRTKVSGLEIDSDDIFEGVYVYDNNFVCNVHMDYLQLDKKRDIRIVGSEGTLVCDFVKKNIRVNRNNKEETVNDASLFDINKTYENELIHFMASIENDTEPKVTLEDGIKALKLLEDGNV